MTSPGFLKNHPLFFGAALFCLAGGGCAALPPAGAPPAADLANEAQYDFAAGQMAEQNRDWALAAAAYRRALRVDPDALVLWRELAEMLMQSEQAGQAVEEFRGALKKHADNPDWIFLMGEMADAAGDSVEAETYYRRAVAAPHPTAAMFTALGLFLLDQERAQPALAYLDKALALDPHDRRARLAEAEAAIDREDYARARAVLKAALAVDPGDEEWLFRWGKVCLLQGLGDEAVKTYQQLLAGDPENADARRALVEIYLEKREYALALPWLEAMQRSEPEDALVKRNLGAVYFEQGQWDAASRELNCLEAARQADAMTHFMLGTIYRQKGLWRLAEQELAQVQRSPELRLDGGLALAGVWIELKENEKASELLADLRPELNDSAPRLLRYALAILRLEGREDPAKAAVALQQALTLAPRDPELRFHLGRVFLAQKKIPEALQAWQRVLRQDPKFAEAANHLAYTCAENNLRLPEAEGWARRAVGLEPGNGNYRDTLAWVYFQEKKYAPALEALQQALAAFQAHPDEMDPVVYDHLGEVYAKLNRNQDALQAWRRACQLNPQDGHLQEKIKRLEPTGK